MASVTVDWNGHQAVCPRGQTSRTWKPLRISGHDDIQVRFGEAACRACTDRARCTNSVSALARPAAHP
ncbi:transposase [Streptomyces sp. NPDC003631]|uniref:transposase n=1 Tax=unclassified Streptomyces TaxID=2593676 RepID=UPI003416A65C